MMLDLTNEVMLENKYEIWAGTNTRVTQDLTGIRT